MLYIYITYAPYAGASNLPNSYEVCAAPFGFSGNADGGVSPGFGAREGAMFIGRLGGQVDQALAGKIASGKLRKNHGKSSFLMGISKSSQVLGGLHRRRQLGQVSSGQLPYFYGHFQ
jgi:hypothetical protein